MQKLIQKLPKINIHSFIFFYIVSAIAIILAGLLVRNHREAEQYKQVILWYENLSGDNNNDKGSNNLDNLSNFLKPEKILNKIKADFQNPNKDVSPKINQKMILKDLPEQGFVDWKIGKTGESLSVYYDYVRLTHFGSVNPGQKINNNQNKVFDDKVFQLFTDKMTSTISENIKSAKANNKDEKIGELQIFSDALSTYLNDNDNKISDLIPYLRINTIYITNVNTEYMISYPLTKQTYGSGLNLKDRPWYKASQQKYYSDLKYGNELGLTGIYIDINTSNNNNPNAIRTLWYKFKGDNNQEYILCIDLFFDKSSQLAKSLSLMGLLEQYIEFLPNIIPDDSRLVELIIFTLFIALALEITGKPIILRNLRAYENSNLPTIILKRDDSNTHYAKPGGKNIEITFQGEIKDTQEKALSVEAGWNVDSKLKVSISANQKKIHQETYTHSYVLRKNYDLDMKSDTLKYRCVEGWNVILSGVAGNENIGHFIVTWSNKNLANLENLIDIEVVTCKPEHQSYFMSIKEQLRQHLLISDDKEFVPSLTMDYTKPKDVHAYFSKIKSFKKLLSNSSYLKQGRMPVSSIEDLIELYNQSKGKVYAICTLNFLQQLLHKNQLQSLFEAPVEERYFIEYQENEFRDFYKKIQNSNHQSFLNKSQLKIMVYQNNINNIIHQQDDFCIILCDGMPNLIAYSFTDDKDENKNIGWISSRELDFNFYNELYQAQKNTSNRRIETVENYIKGRP